MGPDRNGRRPGKMRYWWDIVLLAAFSIFLPLGLQLAGLRPPSDASVYGFMALVALGPVVAGWLLLRLRGERLRDIGLTAPKSWGVCLLVAVLIAGVLFGSVYGAEQLGMKRDLSRFAAMQGNLPMTLWAILFALVGAGFGEEFLFRGFVMRSAAGGLGDGKNAWVAAVLVQAALFGLSHGYQGVEGFLLTGGVGIAVGTLVLTGGRNLWPAIIGHGLYDAARFVYFYLHGPPS